MCYDVFMKKFILATLFPIQCLACGSEGKFICPSCLEQIPLNSEPSAATNYENPLIKKAIHHYKYNFVQELSIPLGALMAKKLNSWGQSPNLGAAPKNCILVPVPLHKKRLRWRGFNQSELLAQEISKQLNIPVASDILIRTKNTQPQAKIENPAQRKANLQNAFALRHWGQSLPRGLSPITIILVDDIATTGATLQECAKALAPLKPKSIQALVLAR